MRTIGLALTTDGLCVSLCKSVRETKGKIKKKYHPDFSEAAILDFTPVGLRSIDEHVHLSSVGLICASSTCLSYSLELRLY